MTARKLLFHFLTLTILFLMGCETDDVPTEIIPGPEKGNNKFSLVVALPSIETTRLALKENATDIGLTWEESDEIQVAFIQGNVKIKQKAKVTNIRDEGKRGSFQFTMPEEINSGRFDIYAVYGAELTDTDPTVVQLPAYAGYASSLDEIDASKVVLTFSQKEIRSEVNEVRGALKHIGSIIGISIQNTGSATLDNLDEVRLVTNDDSWVYNLGTGSTYDIVSGQFTGAGDTENYLSINANGITVGGRESVAMWGWFPIPPEQSWPEFNILLKDITGNTIAESGNSKMLSSNVTVGNSYYIHSQWNGTGLLFTPTMSFTTSRDYTDRIQFRINAEPEDQDGVWIDLNNNGVMESEEKVVSFGITSNDEVYYDFSSPVVTVYGKVKDIQCNSMSLIDVDISGNQALLRADLSLNSLSEVDLSYNALLEYVQLSANYFEELDLSENRNLIQAHVNRNQITSLILPEVSNSVIDFLDISRNKFSAEAITNLLNGLPDRSGLNSGTITVLDSDHIIPNGDRDEFNDVNETHTDLAAIKNWTLEDLNPPEIVVPVEGPSMTFTTARTASTIRIRLYAEVEDREGVWIDFNNNGVMEPAEKVTVFGTASSARVNYSNYGQKFTIYGKVTNMEINGQNITSAEVNNNPFLTRLDLPFNDITEIDLSELVDLDMLQLGVNQLSEIDLSKNTKLTQIQLNRNKLTSVVLPEGSSSFTDFRILNISRNKLPESVISYIVDNLPDRTGETTATTFTLYDNRSDDEDNVITPVHISVAKTKGWNVVVDNVTQ